MSKFKQLTKKSGACLDLGRVYRYALSRIWEPGRGYMLVIGLNPSTADERLDDPTIRRCRSFAQASGFGGVLMGNLFAYRTYSPKILQAARDPIGAANDRWLQQMAASPACGLILAAWGRHGSYLGRDKEVLKLLGNRGIHALRINSDGSPGHPLYIPGSARPTPFPPKP